jgi:biopolymer transport protein ExbB
MTVHSTSEAPLLQLAQANTAQPVTPAPVTPQVVGQGQTSAPAAAQGTTGSDATAVVNPASPAPAANSTDPVTEAIAGSVNEAINTGDAPAVAQPQTTQAPDTIEPVASPVPVGNWLNDGVEQIRAIMEMGGPVVMLLAVLSVLSLTVILYKLWQFSWLGIGRHKRARKALSFWRQGQQVEAINLLSKGKAPVSVVLLHAMRGQLFHSEKGNLIREDVERVALRSLSKTRFLLRFLETVGQISPLLGLFGTVIGMIEAFQRLQQAGATVDPSVLAGGIWVALLTTAVGLAVAIPASLFADWFSSRVEREQEVIEELVTSVLTGQITDASAVPSSAEVSGEPAYAT